MGKIAMPSLMIQALAPAAPQLPRGVVPTHHTEVEGLPTIPSFDADAGAAPARTVVDAPSAGAADALPAVPSLVPLPRPTAMSPPKPSRAFHALLPGGVEFWIGAPLAL